MKYTPCPCGCGARVTPLTARVVSLLLRSPLTSAQLAARLGRSRGAAKASLRAVAASHQIDYTGPHTERLYVLGVRKASA